MPVLKISATSDESDAHILHYLLSRLHGTCYVLQLRLCTHIIKRKTAVNGQ